MTLAVDTNILFDILLPDPKHVDNSLSMLKLYGRKHRLVISEVVYGELASQFQEINFLKQFLADVNINLIHCGETALWEAARAWKEYAAKRNIELQCPACGNRQILFCSGCEQTIASRQHILCDFIIGGHALHHADCLLTRDRGYYKRYFPKLKLLP